MKASLIEQASDLELKPGVIILTHVAFLQHAIDVVDAGPGMRRKVHFEAGGGCAHAVQCSAAIFAF